MKDRQRAYIYLHISVFLWGFTAILGKLISLQALPLVWWRVILCCLTLLLTFPLQALRDMPRWLIYKMLGIGFIVGLHWMCFYSSIKLSNASVAVTTMAATAFFSALAEPLLFKQKIKWHEMILGLLILPGMALVVGNIDWNMRLGFAVGILGALLAAIFTALNKQIVMRDQPPALVMSFVEMFGVFLVTSLFLPVFTLFLPQMSIYPSAMDWLWLGVLAWFCTLLPYTLTLKSMQQLSAFIANLSINLEPIYGIILAGIIFREDRDLNTGFYLGVLIILLAVFGHPFLKKRFEKEEAVENVLS
ncbi:MAG: EamA family transporter [Bacteroidetes bacterium]|nr:EamA family transporter [Bacteroidota bacterium]